MSFKALAVSLFVSCLSLTGCFLQSPSQNSPASAGSLGVIQGQVHGGRQPVIGAHLYVLAAATTGYGGPGLTASTTNASTSLLTSVTSGSYPTQADTSGDFYVTTGAAGDFTLDGEYVCAVGQQVYLYAVGGNPGSGSNNLAAAFTAVLGQCPASGTLAGTVGFVEMNEVTTVAAAYAMAGFATDATHVGSSGSALALTGIANAFASAGNIVALGSAVNGALTTTPGGNGLVPAALVNSLGNSLAACVNSSGSGSVQCSTLFMNASSGGSTGVVPTDTATAAINIAHNPGQNVTTIFQLPTPIGYPYSPNLGATAPNDFAVVIQYSGSMAGQRGPAVDAAGNVWIASVANDSLVELSPVGTPVTGSPFTGGGMASPSAVAIDSQGNVWVGNISSTLSKFSSSGTPVVSSGYSLSQALNTFPLAIDKNDNVWSGTNGLGALEVSNAGSYMAYYSLSNSEGGGAISVDGSNNIWFGQGEDLVFLNAANAYSQTSFDQQQSYATSAVDAAGYVWAGGPLATLTRLKIGGSGSEPLDQFLRGVAIDGAGNAWVAANDNGVWELASSTSALPGKILSPNGYVGGLSPGSPFGVAVDGSGNVWACFENYLGVIFEYVGAATPVATPISYGVRNNMLGARP